MSSPIGTDGAAAIRGRFFAARQKVFPITHVGVVIAGRGKETTLRAITRWIEDEFTSFDEVLAAARNGEFTKRFRWRKLLMPWRYGFQIIVGGITDEGKPTAFFWSTTLGGDMGNWQVRMIPHYFLSSSDETVNRRFRSLVNRFEVGEAFRTVLLDERREQTRDCPVGAFAQVTRIRKVILSDADYGAWNTIIQSEIIWRWDETFGHPIDITNPGYSPARPIIRPG